MHKGKKKMTYFRHMGRVLALDTGMYRQMARTRAGLGYCVINVAGTGLIYALSAIYFGRMLLNRGAGGPVDFKPLLVILVGICLAFLIHGGATMFFWVFSRGFGGSRLFMPLYQNLGIAAIALWPLAPAVCGMQSGAGSAALAAYMVLAGMGGLMVALSAIRQASGLPPVKLAMAVSATLLYIGCFLYLWM